MGTEVSEKTTVSNFRVLGYSIDNPQTSLMNCTVNVASKINSSIFIKLGMYEYIMAAELTSTAFFIRLNPTHICLYVYLLSLLGNGSAKRY
jgi:hypothetical protein